MDSNSLTADVDEDFYTFNFDDIDCLSQFDEHIGAAQLEDKIDSSEVQETILRNPIYTEHCRKTVNYNTVQTKKMTEKFGKQIF